MVIRVSGSHGSGKSTLCEDLVRCLHLTELSRAALPETGGLYEHLGQHLLRHLSEASRDREICRRTDSPHLQERCILDWYAYLAAYRAIGLIDSQQHDALLRDAGLLHASSALPSYLIFIDRPIEWIKARLAERSAAKDIARTAVYAQGLTEAVSARLGAIVSDVANRGIVDVLYVRTIDRIEAVNLVQQWLLNRQWQLEKRDVTT